MPKLITPPQTRIADLGTPRGMVPVACLKTFGNNVFASWIGSSIISHMTKATGLLSPVQKTVCYKNG